MQLTDVKGRLQGYEWSPDSTRLALVIGDPDPDAAEPGDGPAKPKTPKPIVIDRYKFKQDVAGISAAVAGTASFTCSISRPKSSTV